MAFLAPFFIAALTAIAIPIVVHLLQVHRPKTVAFSTLAFFTELRRKTMRRLAIKRWLLLAMRVAAVALLAMALMRPFLKPDAVFWSGGPVMTAILIDNGPTMGRIDRNGPYLEQAVSAAMALIDQAKETDRFWIEASFGPSEPSGLLTPDEARLRVSRIGRSDAANRTSERWARVATAMREAGLPNRRAYWITDARLAQSDVLSQLPPEGLTLVRVGDAEVSNLQVTDVTVKDRIGGPGRPLRFEVVVRNNGSVGVPAGFVSLEKADELVAQFPIALDPGQAETLVFETVAPASEFVGAIVLEGDGYAADNRHPVVFRLPERKRVRVVGPTPDRSPFWAAVGAMREVSSSVDVERVAVVTDADAVVLHQAEGLSDAQIDRLTALVQNGAGLVLFPAPDADPSAYDRLLRRVGAGRFTAARGTAGATRPVSSVDAVTEGHPLMEGLFDNPAGERIRTPLPTLYRMFRYDPAGATVGVPVFRSVQGDPLLTEHRFGSGVVYVAAFGTDERSSDFPANPLYAPLMASLLQTAAGVGRAEPQRVALGQPLSVVVPAGAGTTGSRVRVGDVELVPELLRLPDGRARLRAATTDAAVGLAEIRHGAARRTVAITPALPDHDLTPMPAEALAAAGVADVRSAAALSARELSTGFLVAAFLLLLAESLVARYMRV
jgi:hypothetical protein